jgi:sulfur carrier protein ThiS
MKHSEIYYKIAFESKIPIKTKLMALEDILVMEIYHPYSEHVAFAYNTDIIDRAFILQHSILGEKFWLNIAVLIS